MPKIAQRIIRALFNGFVIGLIGGTGIYLTAEGVNALAGQSVVNPIALLLLILGGSIAGAVGIDLSKDMEESK